MTRHFRSWTWTILLIGAAGCGDNIAAIQRDYYNVKHETLDNMMRVVDENSAKRFNEVDSKRLKEKETASKERLDKIKNNLFSQKDREAFDREYEALNTITLKGQKSSGNARLFQTLNRVRRIIVKVVSDEAVELKKQEQSFTIRSSKLCPNLTSLEGVGDFAGMGEGGNTAGGGMMMLGMGGPPGAPGAGQPAAQPAAAPVVEKIDARAYQNFQFVLVCTKTGNPAQPWNDDPSWRVGDNKVEPLVIPINGGINLLPLSSKQ